MLSTKTMTSNSRVSRKRANRRLSGTQNYHVRKKIKKPEITTFGYSPKLQSSKNLKSRLLPLRTNTHYLKMRNLKLKTKMRGWRRKLPNWKPRSTNFRQLHSRSVRRKVKDNRARKLKGQEVVRMTSSPKLFKSISHPYPWFRKRARTFQQIETINKI